MTGSSFRHMHCILISTLNKPKRFALMTFICDCLTCRRFLQTTNFSHISKYWWKQVTWFQIKKKKNIRFIFSLFFDRLNILWGEQFVPGGIILLEMGSFLVNRGQILKGIIYFLESIFFAYSWLLSNSSSVYWKQSPLYNGRRIHRVFQSNLLARKNKTTTT